MKVHQGLQVLPSCELVSFVVIAVNWPGRVHLRSYEGNLVSLIRRESCILLRKSRSGFKPDEKV